MPDGAFITTNFLPRGGTPEATQQMMGGAANGGLGSGIPRPVGRKCRVAKRQARTLGFRVDNIHWAATARYGPWARRSRPGKQPGSIPERSASEVVSQPDTREFGAGTVVLEVGDKLWVGSYIGNGIAIVPAP